MPDKIRLSVAITCSSQVGPYIPAQVLLLRNTTIRRCEWFTCFNFSRVSIHSLEFQESDYLRHIDLGPIEIDQIERFYETFKEMYTDHEEIFIIGFACKLAAKGLLKQDAVNKALAEITRPLGINQARRAKRAIEAFRKVEKSGVRFNKDWRYLDEPLDMKKMSKWHPVGKQTSFAVEGQIESAYDD
ncbi:hypothetical protein BDW74DRAFT_181212 [Aspergillus multicolor]|uniref:uncharacterized protein n=1 Tax=Aspergillus multicolor TaxID=41759 RepID=UPI003CCD7100